MQPFTFYNSTTVPVTPYIAGNSQTINPMDTKTILGLSNSHWGLILPPPAGIVDLGFSDYPNGPCNYTIAQRYNQIVVSLSSNSDPNCPHGNGMSETRGSRCGK